MDQVLEFGKRYGKWIVAGVAAGAVAVAGVFAYKAMSDDVEYVDADDEPKALPEETDQTDETA